MSPTAVSRSVAELEDRLGVRLFARTTRTVRLTEAGVHLVGDARKILADLLESEMAVSGAEKALRGRITLTAPVLFGRRYVAQVVLDFIRKYPEIVIDLQLLDRTVDLLEGNIDIAIRIADLSDSSLTAVRIGSVGRVLCASPDFLTRRGEPRTLADLALMDGIELTSASPRQWAFRQGRMGKIVRPNIVLGANSPEVVVAATLQGLGVARFMDYQVKDEIRSERLKPLLTRWEMPPQAVHIVYRSHRHLPERVRVLISCIKAALRSRAQ